MFRLVGVLLLCLPVQAAIDVQLVPLVTGLNSPVQIVSAHDGTDALYVALQSGVIQRINSQGMVEPFLDLSGTVSCCSNGGLLSVVFHPNYAVNGKLYVLYVDFNGNTALAMYSRSDPRSGQVLLVAGQPKDNVPNHHGGTLLFGPDGFLYVSIGDGGAFVQVTNRAQEITHLLGKILRLDVDHGVPYAIPADNPFAGVPGARGEIWSYGLRNPWRYSFDRATGELLIADVGQDSWEEVNVITVANAKGANFGWPVLEGSHCFPPATQCSKDGFVLPAIEYPHSLGCSITGGYRYRGTRWPAWYGTYFYGDFCSGRLWAATQQHDGSWSSTEIVNTGKSIVSFGEDDQGELYLVDYAGTVYRMVPGGISRRHAVGH